MEISDRIYKDEIGVVRLLDSRQRVADIIFRINSGWDEGEVVRSRRVSIDDVRHARAYYQTHRKEIDSQVASIYGKWKAPIEVPQNYVPIIQSGRIVGYRRQDLKGE